MAEALSNALEALSAMVVAGPLAVAMRKMWSSLVTDCTAGSRLSRSAHPSGTAEKLASMAFWLGMEALSLSGESSATSLP